MLSRGPILGGSRKRPNCPWSISRVGCCLIASTLPVVEVRALDRQHSPFLTSPVREHACYGLALGRPAEGAMVRRVHLAISFVVCLLLLNACGGKSELAGS